MLFPGDTKGEERYLNFLGMALPAYDKAKAAGKTPQQLLNSESPDYIGKLVEQFKPKADQTFLDKVQDQGPGFFARLFGATPAVPFDAATIGSYTDLKAAFDAGKVSGAEANRIGLERGWVRRPAPTTQVPISQ